MGGVALLTYPVFKLISGPSGSGKTTMALEQWRPGELIIDWDRLLAAVTNIDIDTHPCEKLKEPQRSQYIPIIEQLRNGLIEIAKYQENKVYLICSEREMNDEKFLKQFQIRTEIFLHKQHVKRDL